MATQMWEDFLGVSLIIPLLLTRARDLGFSSTLAGLLGSVYGCVQLLSSPVMGKWSDTVSRQYSLFLCLLLCSFGYTSLGFFTSFITFFCGRFFLGCFKHSQTISKAFLADFVPREQLPGVIGKFNSFSSIGFIIGPIIGGHLADSPDGFKLAACIAGLIFLINSALIWWIIPTNKLLTKGRSVDDDTREKYDKTAAENTAQCDDMNISFTRLLTSFREYNLSSLWDLLLIKFLAAFSILLFRANFSLVLKDKYEVNQKIIGYLTSYSGVVTTMSGFFMYKIIQRYKSSGKLFFHVTILQVIVLISLTASSSVIQLVIFLTPLSAITSISRTTSITMTLHQSRDSTAGSMMGLNQSVMSLARMLAPFAAGVAQEFTIDGASYLSIAAASISVVMMCWRQQHNQQREDRHFTVKEQKMD